MIASGLLEFMQATNTLARSRPEMSPRSPVGKMVLISSGNLMPVHWWPQAAGFEKGSRIVAVQTRYAS